MRTLLAAVALAAGCNQILGTDGTLTVGGAATGVTGHSTLRYVTPTGVEEGPEDLTYYEYTAYVPDDAEPGGFRVYAGTSHADGTFEIPDVPEGRYLLKVLAKGKLLYELYDTDQRVLDMSSTTIGRAGRPDVKLPTTVRPNMTGLARVVTSDPFTVHSDGNGTEVFPVEFDTDLQVGPAKPLTASFDWSKGYGWAEPGRRAKILQNDDVWVVQSHERPLGQFGGVDTIAGVAHVTGLTQQDGQPLDLVGTFTPVTPTASATFVGSLATIRSAYGTQINTREFLALTVASGPASGDGILFGPSLAAAFYSNVPKFWNPPDVTAMYANPFPSTWAPYATTRYVFSRRIRSPGATVSASFSRSAGSVGPVGSTLRLDVNVPPPQNLRINDMAATDGRLAFDGVAPVRIEWNTVANATRYSVSFSEIRTEGGATRIATIFSLATTKTKLTLPAALFDNNVRYAWSVIAFRQGTEFDTGVLKRVTTPSADAAAMGGMMLFSSTCGDGMPQAPEECDTTTATSACDLDCSLPVCGDGLRNAAAGEACDDGWETAACDADCSLATCGDGFHNVHAEECDDGNTISGDGCSNCRIDPGRCGNNIKEPWEQCDPGNATGTDSCNPKCEFAQCGDGYKQSSEACDDGNFDDGDLCSTSCTITP